MVAANQGAALARGEFILFLNNDAEPMPGSLAALVDTLSQSPSIGAVGGKLVFPDGTLQEAGGIVWSDGACESYGRGQDPSAPEFCFERDVDFCSGAFFLTRRETFQGYGGFDERYRPAYYEDVDYCVRLWKDGLRVVYQPAAVAIHFEFGSASHAPTRQHADRETRHLCRRAPRLAGRSAVAGAWRRRRCQQTSIAPKSIHFDDILPDPNLELASPAPRRCCGLCRTWASI